MLASLKSRLIDMNPPDIREKKIIRKFMNVWWTKKRWILIPSLSLRCAAFLLLLHHIRVETEKAWMERGREKKCLSECFIFCSLRSKSKFLLILFYFSVVSVAYLLNVISLLYLNGMLWIHFYSAICYLSFVQKKSRKRTNDLLNAIYRC